MSCVNVVALGAISDKSAN